jgi:hypothetical protein
VIRNSPLGKGKQFKGGDRNPQPSTLAQLDHFASVFEKMEPHPNHPSFEDHAVKGAARREWFSRVVEGGKGWSVHEFSRQQGAPSYNTMRRWLSGKKSQQDIQVRAKIAKVLDIAISEVPE